MCGSTLITQLGVLLTGLLLGGVIFAGDAAPTKPGIYDGAVAVKLNEIEERSLARVNPEEMQNAPWPLVQARIEQMTGMQVRVDAPALMDEGIEFDKETVVPLWPAGETLAQLTNRLAEKSDIELSWLVDDRLATLTTADEALNHYVTRQYPIGDLLYQGSPIPVTNALYQETSGPWDIDEPGTGTLSPLGNLLFVRQTHRVHQEVAEALAAMRRDEPIVLTNSSEEDLRIRRLLEEQRISFEFPDNTMQEFVEGVQAKSGIKIRLDVICLNDAGINDESRLEARAVDLPLFVALQQSLQNVNGTELTVRVSDNECWITTAEKANERYETVLYRMPAWGISAETIDEFAAMIESKTSGPWDADEPGTGTLSWIPGRKILAIRQTQRVHREILEILRGLKPTRTVSPPVAARPVVAPAAPVALAEPQSEPHAARPAPSVTGSLTPSIRRPFTVATWERVADYVPLLLALLLGCATGYVYRH